MEHRKECKLLQIKLTTIINFFRKNGVNKSIQTLKTNRHKHIYKDYNIYVADLNGNILFNSKDKKLENTNVYLDINFQNILLNTLEKDVHYNLTEKNECISINYLFENKVIIGIKLVEN